MYSTRWHLPVWIYVCVCLVCLCPQVCLSPFLKFLSYVCAISFFYALLCQSRLPPSLSLCAPEELLPIIFRRVAGGAVVNQLTVRTARAAGHVAASMSLSHGRPVRLCSTVQHSTASRQWVPTEKASRSCTGTNQRIEHTALVLMGLQVSDYRLLHAWRLVKLGKNWNLRQRNTFSLLSFSHTHNFLLSPVNPPNNSHTSQSLAAGRWTLTHSTE